MNPNILKNAKTTKQIRYPYPGNYYLLFIIIALFFPVSIMSQEIYKTGGLRFEHFQAQDGLPTNSFGRFLQDSKGRIWLGTIEGLVWYDGYEFYPLQPIGASALLIKEIQVSALFEDSQGYIWIGTFNLGVFRYDPVTNQLRQFPTNKSNYAISSIGEDASGSICISTWNGFYRILFPIKNNRDSFQRIAYHPVELPESLFRLADSLSQNGKRLASLLYEEQNSKHTKSFSIYEETTTLVLSMGIRRRSITSDFVHKVGIMDQNGHDFWSMSLTEAYDTGPLGPSRIQAALLDFPPGSYQLSFRYEMASNLEVPQVLFPYLGIQVFEITKEEAAFVRAELVKNRPEASIIENFQDIVFTDTQGITWIGGDGGITKMEIPDPLQPEKVKFKHFLATADTSKGLRTSHVHMIIPSHQDGLWIGGNAFDEQKGIWGAITLDHFDPKTGKFTSYNHGINHPLDLLFLHEDDDRRLWLGTSLDRKSDRTGIYLLDLPLIKKDRNKRPQSTFLSFNPDKIYTASNGIRFIKKDFSGSTWIGTSRKGLFKLNPKNNIFRELELPSGNIEGNVYPLSFLQDSSGLLWIGTNGHGLYQYDLNKGVVNQFLKSSSTSGLQSNVITRLVEDNLGNIWLSTADGLLQQYQIQTKQFSSFPSPIDPYDARAHTKRKYSLDMAPGVENFLWISTDNGLHFFSTHTQTYENHYFHLNDKTVVRSGSPGCILPQKNGNIIIGFHPRKLCNMVLDDDEYHLEPLIDHNRSFSHLTQGYSGYIWGATDHGLYKLKPNGDSLRIYTEQDGLGSDKIRYILPVDKENLWLLTHHGLSRLNLHEHSFNNYLEDNEQLLSSILPGSMLLLNDGRMVCSRKGGFYLFDPAQLKANLIPPKILLTELLVSNKKIEAGNESILEKAIAYTKSFTLKHYQNDLTFKFTGIHFNAPQKNTYQFQLEGYDKAWIAAGTQRQATYTNLPAGKYTFKVRAANSDGIWSEEAATVQIRILPPWWQTWWAISLFVVLGLGLIATLRWFELNRRMAKAEVQKQEELNQLRTKLYTNITHEFRTPLTIILGMTDQLRNQMSEHAKENLHLIERNGQQLLKLVNQMLDLSKLESGQLKLEMEQGDIINYLKYLTQSFQSYAESKNIHLIFQSELKAFSMDYDPVRLMHIVSNLLSNAIKFSAEGKKVYLKISINPLGVLKTPRGLILTIKDSGIGIPKSKIPYIFDRFYQVDDSMTRKGEGTGIGLTLTKELVHLMGGEIRVSSTLGEGSEFSVILPITRNHKVKMLADVKMLIPKTPAPILPKSEPMSVKKSDTPIILIVEDNPDLVKYLITSFNGAYQLKIAYDGQQGIDKALSIIPDIIITDVMMPEKDGFELCATLKNHKLTSHIPIIMLTAKVNVEARLTGLKKGADAYLGKPFLEEELQIQIKVLLEQRKKLQIYYRAQAGLSEAQNTGAPSKEASTLENTFLASVNQIITNNLSNHQFTVEQLCKELFLTPSNLYRKLTALTGINPSQYIRSHRLAKAKILLKTPSNSITNIALETGFKNAQYFSRLFKKEFGITPSEYRHS